MQIKWVRDNIMTDLTWKVQIQSQVNGTNLTRVCWMIVRHKKTRIFRVFDCEMQRKWVRDKSYGRFSMQSKNTISNKWNDSYQSVLDDLWAQKTTIFGVCH